MDYGFKVVIVTDPLILQVSDAKVHLHAVIFDVLFHFELKIGAVSVPPGI